VATHVLTLISVFLFSSYKLRFNVSVASAITSALHYKRFCLLTFSDFRRLLSHNLSADKKISN